MKGDPPPPHTAHPHLSPGSQLGNLRAGESGRSLEIWGNLYSLTRTHIANRTDPRKKRKVPTQLPSPPIASHTLYTRILQNAYTHTHAHTHTHTHLAVGEIEAPLSTGASQRGREEDRDGLQVIQTQCRLWQSEYSRRCNAQGATSLIRREGTEQYSCL